MAKNDMSELMEKAKPETIGILPSRCQAYNNFISIYKGSSLQKGSFQMRKKNECDAAVCKTFFQLWAKVLWFKQTHLPNFRHCSLQTFDGNWICWDLACFDLYLLSPCHQCEIAFLGDLQSSTGYSCNLIFANERKSDNLKELSEIKYFFINIFCRRDPPLICHFLVREFLR